MNGTIVHEWIESVGGAEKVLSEMAETFPDAEVACLWDDTRGAALGRRLRESPLSKTPLRRSKALSAPLMPLVWAGFRPRSESDWMLISSHAFAHHAGAWLNLDIPSYVYTHTPARYVWFPDLDERGASWWAGGFLPPLRSLDRRRAKRPHMHYAANSRFVKARIERVWEVPARVIYPPVDTARMAGRTPDWLLSEQERQVLASLPRDFLLGASRWVPYKGLDKVIRAGKATDLPVVIAGRGPDEARLREVAAQTGAKVVFFSSPSDTALRVLYERCLAFVFPAVEDFGIMPVEAMAAGARVIVNAEGGAAESVVHGSSGVHVHDFSDLGEVQAAVTSASRLSPDACRERADRFSVARFRRELAEWVAT